MICRALEFSGSSVTSVCIDCLLERGVPRSAAPGLVDFTSIVWSCRPMVIVTLIAMFAADFQHVAGLAIRFKARSSHPYRVRADNDVWKYVDPAAIGRRRRVLDMVVASSVSTTAALGITAPVGSAMVPWIVPVPRNLRANGCKRP